MTNKDAIGKKRKVGSGTTQEDGGEDNRNGRNETKRRVQFTVGAIEQGTHRSMLSFHLCFEGAVPETGGHLRQWRFLDIALGYRSSVALKNATSSNSNQQQTVKTL